MGQSFEGNLFDEVSDDESTYHTITTDNPMMAQLGLSSFSTGTLFAWWMNNNGGNRQYFVGADGNSINPTPNILFLKAAEINMSGVSGFDTKANKYSEHKVFPLNTSTWSHISPLGTKYSYLNHPGKTSFDYIRYSTNAVGALDIINSPNSILNPSNDFSASSSNKFHSHEAISLILDNTAHDLGITTLIEANNYVVQKLNNSKGKLDNSWNDGDKFLAALTSFIKTSKHKCVSWSKNITFRFSSGGSSCEKSEVVNFKLYLFDNFSQKSTVRTLALPNSTTIGVPTTPTGQVKGGKVAAKVKGSYDETSGLWNYGTEIILATVSETITAAKTNSTSATLLSQAKSDKGSDFHLFGKGKAIPIISKNGDPRTWSAESDFSKCGKKKAIEVIVYNPNSSTIEKDETVYLISINSRWLVMKPDTRETFDAGASVTKSWNFTYLITSRDNFFRKHNGSGTKIADPNINGLSNSLTYESEFKASYYFPTSPVDVQWSRNYNQITSFDFMSSHIGGVRQGGDTLLATNYQMNLNNELYENTKVGYESFPFFGCVFPNGWNTEEERVRPYFSNGEGVKLKEFGEDTTVLSKKFLKTDTIVVRPFKSDVNKNKGPSNSSGPDEGIFKNKIAGDFLPHLPADIALNASPSGQFGSPIVNVIQIPSLAPTGAIGIHVWPSFLRRNVHKYLRSVYNDEDGTSAWVGLNITPLNKYDSTFDLEPINSSKIQFRPIMLEVFGMYKNNPVGLDCVNNKRFVSELGTSRLSDGKSAMSDNYYDRAQSDIIRYGSSNICHGSVFNQNIPPFNQNFDNFMFSSDWAGEPPIGIGIITASCTKSARNTIKFDTSCFLGRANRRILNNFYPVWGSTATVEAINTTTLHARIFQSWPKKQTIFDPRYFAVFHFNKGVENFAVDGDDPPYADTFGAPLAEYVEFINGVGVVDKLRSGGYRVPTFVHTAPGLAFSTPDEAPLGLFVWKDKTYTLAPLGFHEPLRSIEDWNIDRKEMGVLLPYIGKRKTLTINVSSVVFKDRGKNYKKGDRFYVFGSWESDQGEPLAIIEVLTIDDPIIGNIGTLKLISSNSFEPSDFPTHAEAVAFNVDNAKFVISPILPNKNESAKFSFTQGEVIDVNKTISGPKEILSTTLISANTIPKDDSVTAGIISDTVSKTVTLDAKNRSVDNMYDIFMYFHNDVGHTMVDASDLGSSIPSFQQFIETDISVT